MIFPKRIYRLLSFCVCVDVAVVAIVVVAIDVAIVGFVGGRISAAVFHYCCFFYVGADQPTTNYRKVIHTGRT